MTREKKEDMQLRTYACTWKTMTFFALMSLKKEEKGDRVIE